MSPTRNPFNPGAGYQPPELAGRDQTLEAAQAAIDRIRDGGQSRGIIVYGLRGVGKTVLLVRIEELVEQAGFHRISLEADEDVSLADALIPELQRVLRAMNRVEKAKHFVLEALNKIRDVAAAVEISYSDASISLKERSDTLQGAGNFEVELRALLTLVGEAAKASGQPLAIFIDELQYLHLREKGREFGALIAAIHRVGQKGLPVIVFGAALPQIMGIAGNLKSYAERIFVFLSVGRLANVDAKKAIQAPILNNAATIDDDALERIVEATRGYPYFLQEYGFNAWHAASKPLITLADVETAHIAATASLDQSFFQVRLQRLTPKEKRYLYAMATLGEGPYKSAVVAGAMSEPPGKTTRQQLSLVKKGMIWSPVRGWVDFTVPMFDAFMLRHGPGEDEEDDADS